MRLLYLVKITFSITIFTNTLIGINVSAQNCSVNAGISGQVCASENLILYGGQTGPIETGAVIIWTQVGGPSATIESPNSLETPVNNLIGGNTYIFRLYTTCGDGELVYQDVQYEAKDVTIANAGSDKTYCPTETATLEGNSVNSNETVNWSEIVNDNSGISINGSANIPNASLNLSDSKSGSITYAYTITSDNGCISSDEVTIWNRGGQPQEVMPPINADQCYSISQSVKLQAPYAGSGIDGQIGTWTVVSGPSIPNIGNVNNNTSNVSNLLEGTYTLRWSVAGPCVNYTEDVDIIVAPPTANVTSVNLGNDITFCDPSIVSTVLNGVTPQYVNETVLWEQISGDNSVTISSPNSPVTEILGLVSPNSYQFRYSIDNTTTNCDNSDVITVKFEPNAPNIQITSPSPLSLDCDVTEANIAFTQSGDGTTQYLIEAGPPIEGVTYPTNWTNVSDNNSSSSNEIIPNLTSEGSYAIAFRRFAAIGQECNTQVSTIKVIVSISPSVSNAGTSQFLDCNVTGTTLIGSNPEEGIGTWSQVSGPSSVIIQNPNNKELVLSNLLPDNDYTMRWLINGGHKCATTQSDVRIIIASIMPENVTVGDDIEVCLNETVTLEGSLPQTNAERGTWTVTPETGVIISDINDNNATVTGLSSNTTYTFTWTMKNSCGETSKSMLVTVSEKEGTLKANAGTNMCYPSATSNFQLNGSSPLNGSGTWTEISGIGSSISDINSENTSVNVSSQGTYLFEWKVVNNTGCISSADTVTIYIGSEIEAIAGSDINICDTITTLTGNDIIGTSVLWEQISGNAGILIDKPNENITDIKQLEEGQYTFKYTVSNGACEDSDTVQIFSSQPPSQAIINNTNPLVCGTSTQLDADSIISGEAVWIIFNGPSVPAIDDPRNHKATISNLVTGTYSGAWAVSSGPNCPVNIAPINVTAVESADAGQDQSFCENISSTNLIGTVASNGTWTLVDGAPVSIVKTSGNTATANGLNAGSYTFRYTIDTLGCNSFDEMTVSIFSPPTGVGAGVDQEACDMDSIVLSAPTPTSGTGEWFILAGNDNGYFIDKTSPTAIYKDASYGTYVFEWRVTNGTCSYTDQVRVTNNEPPSSAIAGNDIDLLCDTEIQLSANDPNVGIGNWSFIQGEGSTTPIFSSSVLYNTTISNLSPQINGMPANYSFEWRISNGNCPSSADTVNIIVNKLPTQASINDLTSLCNASEFELIAEEVLDGTGMWNQIAPASPLANIIDNDNDTTIVNNLITGIDYQFGWTTTLGQCVSSDDATITNYATPDNASAFLTQTNYCNIQPIILNATLPSLGQGLWSQISGNPIVILDPTLNTSSVVGGESNQTYGFKWEVSNGNCTPNDTSVTITMSLPPTFAIAGADKITCESKGYVDLNGNTSDSSYVSTKWAVVSPIGSGATFDDESKNDARLSGLTADEYLIEWQHYTQNGCTNSDTLKLIVYPKPVVSITVNESHLCNNSETNISLSSSTISPEPILYSWTVSSSSSITGASNGNGNTIQQTLKNNGTELDSIIYTVTPYTGGCAGNAATTKIYVNPKAQVNSQSDIINCNNTTTQAISFTTTNTDGITTYKWYNSDTSSGIPADGSGNIPSYLVLNNTSSPIVSTIKVVPVYENNIICESDTMLFDITVNPSGQVNTMDTITYCSEQELKYNFTSNNTGGISTYEWTNNNSNIGLPSIGSGSLDFTTENTTTAPISGTVTVTPYFEGCIGSAKDLIININPAPQVNSTNDILLCNESTVNEILFTTNNTGGVTSYNWTNNTTSIGLPANGESSIPSFIAINNSSDSVVAEIVVLPTFTNNEVGCSANADTFYITIQPTPYVTSPSTLFACYDDPLNYVPTSNVEGVEFEWQGKVIEGNVLGVSSSGTNTITDLLTSPSSSSGKVEYTITPIGKDPTQCTGDPFILVVSVQDCNGGIGISNQVESVTYNGDGTYCAQLNMRIQNYGNTTIDSIQVDMNLESVFGVGNYSVQEISATSFAVDTSYNGSTNTNMLTNSGTLNTLKEGESTNISYKVIISRIGTFNLSAEVIGRDVVTLESLIDVSQNGSDPDPDGDGNPNNNNRVTPIVTECVIAKIDAGEECYTCDSKYTISGASASNYLSLEWLSTGDGTFANNQVLDTKYMVGANDILNGETQLILKAESYLSCGTILDTVTLKTGIINITPIKTEPQCSNELGSAIINLTGGNGIINYTLNDTLTQTSNTFTNLGKGNHSITVTDELTCSVTTDLYIDIPDPIVATIDHLIDPSCFNYSDGEISIDVTGGVTPYTFEWKNSSGIFATTNSNTASGLIADTYEITITDSNGCTKIIENIVLNNPAALSIVLDQIKNISCLGGSDGEITVSAMGGNYPYTYSWSNNNYSSNYQTDLQAGYYQVSVKDNNGCSASYPLIEITEPSTELIGSIDVIKSPSCEKSIDGVLAASATGGIGNYTYKWSNGALTDTISVVPSGLYQVLITDDNGCEVELFKNISDPSGIHTHIDTIVHASCFQASNGLARIKAEGGTLPYSYQWSDGQTTTMAANLEAGAYNITVSDYNGCSSSQFVLIQEAPMLQLAVDNIDAISCNGNSDGEINVSTNGGTYPYKYEWRDENNNLLPSESNSVSNILGGEYNVTVIDSNMCNLTVTGIQVDEPSSLTAQISKIKDASCMGYSDGAALIVGSGGIAPYYYLWDNGSTDALQDNLSAGTHSVSITDSNGCNISQSIEVLQSSADLDVSVNQINPSCYGINDGSITITPSGGAAPYTILWENGSNSLSRDNLSNGLYVLKITDNSGCSIEKNILLNYPAPIQIQILNIENIKCHGTSTGNATVVAQGGSGNYTFSWSNGDNTSTATNLSVGYYTVTVSDDNGCSSSLLVPIQEADKLIMELSTVTPPSCNSLSDGEIICHSSGGTYPYSYSIIENSVETPLTSNIASNLKAGTYSIKVIDANNCSYTIPDIVVDEPSPVVISLGESNMVNCKGGDDGNAWVQSSGGTSPYTYQWSNNSTEALQHHLKAQTYTVKTIDANGCESTTLNVEITEPSQILTGTINIIQNPSCEAQSDGIIEAKGNGGTGDYSYLWSDGQNTNIASGLTSGTYKVIVSDDNGCSFEMLPILSDPKGISANIVSIKDVSCVGGSDGAATVEGLGGLGTYSYTWSNGQIGATASNLSDGDYTVTISDGNCNTTILVSIKTLSKIFLSQNHIDHITCNGSSNGEIAVNATGGVGSYTFNWSDLNGSITGENSNILSNQASGIFKVIAEDAIGCKDSLENLEISEPSVLTLSIIEVSNSTCYLGDNGTAKVLASGGVGPYVYGWSNGSSDPIQTNLSAGTYKVAVSDANACFTDSIQVQIGEPSIGMTGSFVILQEASCLNQNGILRVDVEDGVEPYTYIWSNGMTTQTISNVPIGHYGVRVTDANGCRFEGDTRLIGTDDLTIEISDFENVGCVGTNSGMAEVTASKGTPPYSYQWSDPAAQTTAKATNLDAGFYRVVVTDATGCSANEFVIIGIESSMILSIDNINNVLCNGQSTGQIKVSVINGIESYNYTWTDSNGTTIGNNSNTLTNVAAGFYNVLVTDANNCSTDSTNIEVEEALPLSLSVSSKENPTCYATNTGSINIDINGGTQPYSYLWNDGSTDKNRINLIAGTYSLTITDANNCDITSADIILANASELSVAVTKVNDVSCYNSLSGSVRVDVSGGTPDYYYQWNNGATNQLNSGIPAGVYSVKVTDSNGCVKESNLIEVTQPSELKANTLNRIDVSCNGYNDGIAEVEALGGTQPYTYLWSDGTITSINENLTPGVHSVIIKDANLCETSITGIVIEEPDKLVINRFTKKDLDCFGDLSGEVSISASGGITEYQYVWYNSSGEIPNSNTPLLQSLSADTYNVIITDNNGCSITSSAISLTQPTQLSINIVDKQDVSENGGSDGYIQVLASEGTPNYSYLWDHGAVGPRAISLTAGTYSVSVTDSKLCTYRLENIPIEEPIIIVTVDAGSDIDACPGKPVEIVSASQTNASKLWWIADGPGELIDANTISPTYIPLDKYESVVDLVLFGNADGSNNYSSADTTTIYFYELLEIELETKAPTVVGQTASVYYNVNNGTDKFIYKWEPDSIIETLGGDFVKTFKLKESIEFFLTVTDVITNCSNIDSITIQVDEFDDSMVTPTTGISPNGDGRNDIWTIENIENYPENKVVIFNRWGDEIKSYENYNNRDIVWDGRNTKGKLMVSGTYFYIIEIKGYTSRSGWIQLLNNK